MITRVTNAQKLASPWKTAKQETNRKNKQTLDHIIDAYVQYINNPAELVPSTLTHPPGWQWQVHETPRAHPSSKPTRYLCMNQPHDPCKNTTPPRTPPDQPIQRKVTFKPTIETIPGTPDHTIPGIPDQAPPRVGHTKKRIKHAYLRMLLRARAR
jgi:hypothetical protein